MAKNDMGRRLPSDRTGSHHGRGLSEDTFTTEDWFKTFVEKKAEVDASPSPERTAYEAASPTWAEENERLHVETGVTAAEESAAETGNEVAALRDKIVAIRATAIAGLKFKAKYAVEHFQGAPDENVIDSIVDDILAMREREA